VGAGRAPASSKIKKQRAKIENESLGKLRAFSKNSAGQASRASGTKKKWMSWN
jgi:hypothetical protein